MRGFRADAVAWGRTVREILEHEKPRVWSHLPVGSPEEAEYIAWAARWAFHWAAKAI